VQSAESRIMQFSAAAILNVLAAIATRAATTIIRRMRALFASHMYTRATHQLSEGMVSLVVRRLVHQRQTARGGRRYAAKPPMTQPMAASETANVIPKPKPKVGIGKCWVRRHGLNDCA
jgi:hypothetical protein